jgi:hypothetical protein
MLSPPLSAAQAAQLRAPRASLTAWPRPSATRLPPSRAALSLSGSLSPPVGFVALAHPSPARSPPSPSHPVASPLRHTPAPATPPATVPEPSPHPPPARAISIGVSAIPAIMASSPVLAVSSIPSLLRAPIKAPARAPTSPHQLRPSPLLSPEPLELALPCFPRRSGELPSPLSGDPLYN